MKQMKYTLLFCICVIVLFSCNKSNNYNNYVGRNYVYFTLDLNTKQARPLLSPAGIVLISNTNRFGETIGPNGVAVVKSIDKANEYYAFDIGCPYDYPDKVSLQEGEADLYCPKCGSHFQVIYGSGSPTKGPASKPLVRYKVSKQGNILIVSI